MEQTLIQNFSGLYPLSADRALFPPGEPYDSGMLPVDNGHAIYWETCGNPNGKPVLVVHGGPGSGAGPTWRQYFNPANYRIVLFDQRGCGRSTPNAGLTAEGLLANDTQHLMADMESLRELLRIKRWMLFACSWGTTLSLAYAVTHPERVTELLLWSVVTTRKEEIDWLTWQMGHLFPQEMEAFLAPVQPMAAGGNIPLAYHRLLVSPDPAVHLPASEAWCAWEDRIVSLGNQVTASSRFSDDAFRLCFTRLVTNYFGNYAFLDDHYLTDNLWRIAHVPVILIRGRLDVSSQLSISWNLYRKLPLSDLYIIDDTGHGASQCTNALLVSAAEWFHSHSAV